MIKSMINCRFLDEIKFMQNRVAHCLIMPLLKLKSTQEPGPRSCNS